MRHPLAMGLAALLVLALLPPGTAAQLDAPDSSAAWTLTDKTFVAWVRLAQTSQRAGAVIGIENLPGQFDALVFGEITPQRWMPGSDFFRRTPRDQDAFPIETAGADETVQIAAVYGPESVTLYRNGTRYAHHPLPADAPPVAFDSRSIVLLGLRAWESQGERPLGAAIDDVRIYPEALSPEAIAALRPNEPGGPTPLAWWDFQTGPVPRDRMGTFRDGFFTRQARIEDGWLRLEGGFAVIGPEPPRTRDQEDWPIYHVHAWPDEGLCRPYDPNGAIFWKGKYHLMYIYQDPDRPHGGHSWGHLESTDLVNWTFLPPAIVPEPADPDVGIFSGNALVDKNGTPMLCWFGVEAGVCVATAEDDSLVRWRKHPGNPIIPIPREGQPGFGAYTVWDPYLWLEGDTYHCLLGGNTLPDGKDTLFEMTSPDLVNWSPVGPFYHHPDTAWTTEGEDCSCPDFFRLGSKHALMSISHKVGARPYLGTYENGRFEPEQHVRMNWPGAQFFAPESLADDQGRRIFWAWVTDPRAIATQQATGSGVLSLPRVLSLATDGTVRITPVPELEALRDAHQRVEAQPLADGQPVRLDAARGRHLELALEVDPGSARSIRVDVRATPTGSERTGIVYEPAHQRLVLDMTHSTRRRDVAYAPGPLDSGALVDREAVAHPVDRVEAPLVLPPGEPLRLRIFLDGPMLEVFANDRQCLTQQVFPESAEAMETSIQCQQGDGHLLGLDAWTLRPARFVDARGKR